MFPPLTKNADPAEHFLFKSQIKNPRQNHIYSARDESTNPRCHPVLWNLPHTLQVPTYPGQLTYALTSQNTQTEHPSFDCALGGPFDELCSACSQPSRLSVGAYSPLSPRQRFRSLLNFFSILSFYFRFVKDISENFCIFIEYSLNIILPEKVLPYHLSCPKFICNVNSSTVSMTSEYVISFAYKFCA